MPDPTKSTVSATEVSALFDASPYCTRWMLFQKFANGQEAPVDENNRMDWGKRMQPLILDQAVRDLHMEVIPNVNDNYVRRKLSGCTRDGEIICPDRGPGAIDAKAIFDYRIWMQKWGGGTEVPREIEWQLQQQLYVGDGKEPYQWGTIAAFVCGEVKYFDRKPIPALWDMLEERTARFFEDVKLGREPDPMGTGIEIPSLTEFFPTVEGMAPVDWRQVDYLEGEGMGMLTPEGKQRMAALEDARMLAWHTSERLGHERSEKELKAKFMAIAGQSPRILLPENHSVDIKTINRSAYSVGPSSYKTVKVRAP